MTNQHDQGDYVLVHKSKAKISRARKMIIGVMAIGAVSALAGAGTFASFSASTSNDATFHTGSLDLSNKANTGSACFASATNPAGAQNSDADTDSNTTTCNALITALDIRPGVLATAELTLTNTSNSDYNGDLSVFADTADYGNCLNAINHVADIGGTGNLCSAVEMTIQRTNSDFTTGVTCIWPSGCALDNDQDTISTFISSYPTANSPLSLATTVTPNTSKYFVVSLKLKDHGLSSTGIGNDNIYLNKVANFAMRFVLTDAA